VSLSWADDMRHQPNAGMDNENDSSISSRRERETGGAARGEFRGDDEDEDEKQDGMRPPMEMESETWGEATSSEVGPFQLETLWFHFRWFPDGCVCVRERDTSLALVLWRGIWMT
jgi:hypothetical protein